MQHYPLSLQWHTIWSSLQQLLSYNDISNTEQWGQEFLSISRTAKPAEMLLGVVQAAIFNDTYN